MAQKKYSTVIFGCGNPLMGDDGFGPAVIEQLQSRYDLGEAVAAVDASTGVREYLFDYLLAIDDCPGSIIILDAVDLPDRLPGELFFLASSDIPALKTHDFSLHQFPTVNLLSEIEEHTGTTVTILAAQIEYIPNEIHPGLSPSMKLAVPTACETILQILSVDSATR
ncbi:MAG: hydrogenase maturation protease [Desulfopila sp.]|jgi:coenzyme F420 hydrogenase subunit delta|nr:hydrogenase maturation protease [Desulfopila sp.]